MSHASAFAVPAADDPRFFVQAFLLRYTGETRDLMANRLAFFLDWCNNSHVDPIHGVTRTHIEMYARHLEDVRRNRTSTVHGVLCTLRVFYRLLAVDQIIRESPAEYVRLPRVYYDETRIIGLERHDVMAMLHTARTMSVDHAALCTLLAILGLRVSEACRIQISDFADHQRGHRVLRILRKGGKLQTLPLPPVVFRDLDRAAEGRTGQLLYRLDGVTPLDRGAAYRMIRAIAKKAGIAQHVHPHALRHTFVSSALEAGVSIREVQIAAGHSDARTTANYDTARRTLDQSAIHMTAAYFAGGS